jgi:hypothetical protein
MPFVVIVSTLAAFSGDRTISILRPSENVENQYHHTKGWWPTKALWAQCYLPTLALNLRRGCIIKKRAGKYR